MQQIFKSMQQEREVLREFGIKVKGSQLDETLKIINSTYKDQLEKIRASKKENTEDHFLETIINSYKSQIDAKNNKVSLKDNTFFVRTVDPEDIESITQRAYFNSFNLQRAKTNELNDTLTVDDDQKNPKKRVVMGGNERSIDRYGKQNEEKEQCFCKKVMIGENWVECDNGQECKGSIWYHYSCVGLSQNENLEGVNFVCQFCKEASEENGNGEGSSKKGKVGKS